MATYCCNERSSCSGPALRPLQNRPAAAGEPLSTGSDNGVPRAFDAAAFDYLLRPGVAEGRKCRRPYQEETPLRPPGAPLARLRVTDRGSTRVINVADILWLEVAGSYVQVHTAECAHLLPSTLSGLLAELGPGFVRVHRSAAVALAQVRQLRARGKGAAVVELRGGARVDCSRQHRARLIELLGSACLV